MNFSIIVFPGSNCDRDCHDAVTNINKAKANYIWYRETILPETDCVILPGGFSYGDYLRPGAIAATAPIMNDVCKFALLGGLVLGICNGFQVLTELKLLPGTLLKNNTLKFICQDAFLKTENASTPFTCRLGLEQVIKLPVAHAEGNYYIDQNTYEELCSNNQIVFRYSDSNGKVEEYANPNGSSYNIAGICNKKMNVLGLMPHPERGISTLLGNNDGLTIFESIIESVMARNL
ncbi:MAG: phosphoribosylformylglycinamidine synthase subunit PurQ [Cyanobacteriota bacterium]